MILHSSMMGQGEVLILLHGLFGMGSNLSTVAKSQAEHYQVYSLDLRNHGLSFQSPEMSYPTMAEDVLRFMDDKGIDKAHVLGHSMGGKVAMHLALNHEHRLNKLVVADIAPVDYPAHHQTVFAGLKAIDVKRIASRREAEQTLQHYVDEQSVRSFLLKNLYRTPQGVFAWRINIDSIVACYPQLMSAIDAPQAFTGSVLFLSGEHSRYILSEHDQHIQRLFSNVSKQTIADAGHWLHAENPTAFNHAVSAFLRQ